MSTSFCYEKLFIIVFKPGLDLNLHLDLQYNKALIDVNIKLDLQKINY